MVNIKSKKLGKEYMIELITYPNAGGVIKIWENGITRPAMTHVFPNHPELEMHLLDEIHFIHQENAKEEYREIKNFHDMVDIMKRNS